MIETCTPILAHFGQFTPMPMIRQRPGGHGHEWCRLVEDSNPPPYVALNIHGGPRDYESGEVLTFTSCWLCHGLFLTHYQRPTSYNNPYQKEDEGHLTKLHIRNYLYPTM